ncbi:helix-turn-helix transcriptional regulator [Erwinia tracheiphila]|nr:helix-turn-helix transcriptional regulator [Erwinia tracheiphila]UIA82626.1 helix-turn-helix transcriptional regulator [Erwinia tracheiphila]UIA84499.1 helix-turn-helix transcriptional regulator [Erwinia tracheiphila]UIA91215.1 helix-turn-helix transcriptional regulator [Erwinia tracheiphila]UIA93092.1 helix-turn-helix transcriptional regulator [Erwinia tracheiphila]
MVNDRADIATRLIEERAKIGYSQADFARQLDISREGLRLYEMGQRSLNAEFLARAAGFGIDVQYILTGIKSKNSEEVLQAIQPAIHVESGGSANVIQFAQLGSTVNMVTTQKHVTNVKADIKPGVEHITEEQAAKLTKMVSTIAELEQKVRKTPRTYKAIWAAVNSHCRVTRYRLIPLASYAKAEKYLRTWIGRLNSQASAPIVDNDEWRKRKYAYIKINIKNNELWLDEYISKRFGATSLRDLSDAELDKTYKAVAAKKRQVDSSFFLVNAN